VALSAGLLLYRRHGGALEVLLVHPGGPFFQRRDLGAWSLPKGEVGPGEDPQAAARRELAEETGLSAPGVGLRDLGEVRQRGGKRVRAWAFEGDCDPGALRSNHFELEWPPRSGRVRQFPEVDRAAFFALAEARERINPAQAAFLDRLAAALDSERGP
jgi:predicted NUDIX family NTP pyrophosphohydrolase